MANMDLTERVRGLEVQVTELVGNGQPGRVGKLEAKVDDTVRTVNIGLGVSIAIQASIGVVLGLMAAGVFRGR